MAQESMERPPKRFGVMPFWFWNDELSESELLRQIADMDAHGVGGFVIHPRVGLPRSIGWMSEPMLAFMKLAVGEAARRDLKVILYDEGMYPSGSSCGQVVEHDPSLACRCLAWRAHDGSPLPDGQFLVETVETKSHGTVDLIDRKSNSYIRGLHYIDEGPKEDEPPAGDILNPKTAALVLKLVHEKMHGALAAHFGKTIIGCFTDEPDPLGKCRESKHVRAYTTGLIDDANAMFGSDFTPHLPALFFDDEPDAEKHRAFWHRVVRKRMDTSWYAPLSTWCADHGVALCGHPADGDDIGTLKFFQMPGQDIVWRFIEPDQASALEGPQSTQAKVTSSAAIHHGRSRNSNEFCGAYGNQTTFEEFRFLASWLLIRGVNLLIPHAFYYSIRGPRKEERPPDVGPNSAWWGEFGAFADHCKRLSYLNAPNDERAAGDNSSPLAGEAGRGGEGQNGSVKSSDVVSRPLPQPLPRGEGSQNTCAAIVAHVCDVAILCDPAHAPWKCAKPLYENQIDVNYLDWTTLDEAVVDANAVKIGQMTYRHVIIEGDVPADVAAKLATLEGAGHVTRFDEADRGYVARIANLVGRDVTIDPAQPAIRIRHVIRDGRHFYLLHNERKDVVACSITFAVKGERFQINTSTCDRLMIDTNAPISFGPHELKLFEIVPTEDSK